MRNVLILYNVRVKLGASCSLAYSQWPTFNNTSDYLSPKFSSISKICCLKGNYEKQKWVTVAENPKLRYSVGCFSGVQFRDMPQIVTIYNSEFPGVMTKFNGNLFQYFFMNRCKSFRKLVHIHCTSIT